VQGFLRANIEPKTRHFPSVNSFTRIKPLDQAAGLVGIIAFGNVLLDLRYCRFRVKIKRDARQCAGWILRFLLEKSDTPVAIQANGIVFFDLLQIADVINGQDRRLFLPAVSAKVRKFFTEQIISSNDNDIVVYVLPCDNQMQIANRSELVGVVGRTIVNDGKVEL